MDAKTDNEANIKVIRILWIGKLKLFEIVITLKVETSSYYKHIPTVIE